MNLYVITTLHAKGILLMKKNWLLMLILGVLLASLMLGMVACNKDDAPSGSDTPGDDTPGDDTPGDDTPGDEPGEGGGDEPGEGGGDEPGEGGGDEPGEGGGDEPGEGGGDEPGEGGGDEPGEGGGDEPGEGGGDEPESDFTYTLVGNSYIITGVNAGVTEAIIPATYKGVAITGIDAKALAGNTITAFKLDSENKNTNFKVTDGILYSADGKTLLAYPGGKTATSLTVNKNVTSIASGAFSGNTVLATIDLKNTKNIGDEAFKDCTSLATIKCGQNIYTCGKDAFLNSAFYSNADNWKDGILLLKGVTFQFVTRYLLVAADPTLSGEITLGNTIYSIADYAFYGNKNLTVVNVDKTLTSIGAYAFAGCEKMTAFNFSAYAPKDLNASYFGEGAFKDCKSLTIFTVPFNLTTIYAYTFAGCDSMHHMVLHPNQNTIDPTALTGTPITDMYYCAEENNTTEVDPIKGPVPELNKLTSSHEWFYDEDGKVNDTRHKYWHFVDGVPTLWNAE